MLTREIWYFIKAFWLPIVVAMCVMGILGIVLYWLLVRVSGMDLDGITTSEQLWVIIVLLVLIWVKDK